MLRSPALDAARQSDPEDNGRLNELRTDLTVRINALAERIDNGYDVEVRAGELSEPL